MKTDEDDEDDDDAFPVVQDLAKVLLQIAQGMEPKYMQPPLGECKVDDILPRMLCKYSWKLPQLPVTLLIDLDNQSQNLDLLHIFRFELFQRRLS